MLDKTICVIGLGYTGLPIASLLGEKGFLVQGVDMSEHALNNKKGKKQNLILLFSNNVTLSPVIQECCEASDLTPFVKSRFDPCSTLWFSS